MRHVLANLFACCLISLPIAVLAESQRPEERVSLVDNFGWLELGINSALFSYVAVENQTHWLSEVFEKPLIPSVSPNSLDQRFADLAYDRSGGYLHHRIPEAFPYVLLGASMVYFSVEAITTWVRDRSWIEGNVNGDHKIVALLESLAWAYTISITCTHLIGRKRPYLERGWVETHSQDWGDEYSFFSGHTMMGFLVAGFLSRHLGDVFEYRVLNDHSTATRFWLGRFLPYSFLYGMAAYTGYSRIYEQQHYLSDVVVGALVGMAVSNLVYSLHFDTGRPRTAWPEKSVLAIGPYGSSGIMFQVVF